MLQIRTACRPLRTPHDFADRACAFVGGLEAGASQAGHMQENVGQVLIRNDKAVSLRRIEPLDRPYHFEDIRFDFPVMLNTALQSWQIFRPHCHFPCASTLAIKPHFTKEAASAASLQDTSKYFASLWQFRHQLWITT